LKQKLPPLAKLQELEETVSSSLATPKPKKIARKKSAKKTAAKKQQPA
jgi:hypothetical protein